jgi:glycosyltransferase involved in cell wall biosynthesis
MAEAVQPAESDGLSLSAFIICKNESRKIGRCLESVRFCSDIVVVDSGSTDDTLDIVERYRAAGLPIRVFHKDWDGYARQKQFALDQCRGRWCVNLDADERIDDRLAREIARVVTSETPHKGFRLPLVLWLSGYGYAHRWSATEYFLRLVRRDSASYDLSRKIHEGLRVDGSVGRITRGTILHRQSIAPEKEIEKIDRYSSLKVEHRIATGKRPSPVRMMLWPLSYFLKFYIAKRYVFSGWGGFVHSVLNAHYAFLTEWKHWRASLPEDEE